MKGRFFIKTKAKSFQWSSISLITKKEVLVLVKWSKETGNAPNAAQKLQNFLLNQLPTDQFTAEIAGQKKDLQGSADNCKISQKHSRNTGMFFCTKIF